MNILNLVSYAEQEKLRKLMIEPLIRNCPPQLWSNTLLDLGCYPLNPWLNNYIPFISQIDEI